MVNLKVVKNFVILFWKKNFYEIEEKWNKDVYLVREIVNC